jgi:hypothetical protein
MRDYLRANLPAIVASLVFLAIVSLEFAVVLILNGGHPSYVLDDPYIHLALSERIADGRYGLNLGEAAAPASSMLWPLLLAPFAGFAWHSMVPLALNVIAGIGLLFILGDMLRRWEWPAAGRHHQTTLLIGFTIALGMPVHALSGMEHLLQAVLTAMGALGLILLVHDGRARWWMAAALILSPSIRYEGLSLLLGGTLALALAGRRRMAVAILSAGILPLLLFGAFLVIHHLPPVPSSLLVKSPLQAAEGASVLISVLRVLQHNVLYDRTGLVLFMLVLLALVKAPRPAGEGILAWCAALVAATYVLAGIPGTLGRYVLFVLACELIIVLQLWRRELVGILSRWPARSVAFATLISVLIVNPGHFKGIAVAPLMANNNWQQQHQLARFLEDFWRAPAAFTELGRMSYRNESYVLDLWGLGSEEARRLRLLHAPGWMAEIVRSHDVGVALIYDDWFPNSIPVEWTRVATLEIEGRNIVLPSPRMSIYATSPERRTALANALANFAATLPPGSRLIFEADP